MVDRLIRNVLSRLRWRTAGERAARVAVVDIGRAFPSMSRHRPPAYPLAPGRTLMITDAFARGGSERQMIATAAGLTERGYEVRMLALWPLSPGQVGMEDEIARLGITLRLRSDLSLPVNGGPRAASEQVLGADLPELPRWFVEAIAPIGKMIREYRPAVVHGWLDTASVLGGLVSCLLGVPRIVVGQRGMSLPRLGVEVPAYVLDGYRALRDHPNVVILNNSAAGAADYEQWLGLRAGTIRVVRNGFLPQSVRAPAAREIAEYRARLGFPPGAPVVGTLMRFAAPKDPALWLDTAAEIAKARADVRFLLGGYGQLQDAIVDRMHALGLGDRIALPGTVSDVGLIYTLLDVVLLSSTVEGISNVLIEAQAAGRPVVAPDVGGVREAVADGRTGLVVRQRSARHLAEAVLSILGDPAWGARARSEGPAFVADHFGLDRMVGETLEVYGLPPHARR